MKPLLRSCLRWVIFYLVLAGIVGTIVYLRAPVLGVAVPVGAVAGFLLFMSIAYIVGILIRRAELRLIRRGMAGGRPGDGEKIAVVGTIGSTMQALEAPLTRRRCVAYEYKILPAGNEQAADIEGFALVPTTIDGPRGSIRLLAVPQLEFDPDKITLIEHHRNFAEYMERTTFRERPVMNLKAEMAHAQSVLEDDDGRIRYDLLRGNRNADLSSMTVRERILAPGEPVVAIGRYSAARNALVPDPTALLHPVKIVKGDAAEVIRKGKRKDFTDVFLSCGCFLPILAAAFAALTFVPLAAFEEQFMDSYRTVPWAEVQLEQWLDRKVRPRFDPDRGEMSVNLVETNSARGRLNDVRLKRASRDGDDVHLTSDDGSAGVIIRFRERKVASLSVLGGPTIANPDVDVEVLHIGEEEISARITYLSEAVKLRAVFRAR